VVWASTRAGLALYIYIYSKKEFGFFSKKRIWLKYRIVFTVSFGRAKAATARGGGGVLGLCACIMHEMKIVILLSIL
jgi:hypothetical protein